MAAFREVISDCQLQDLGYSGPDFTWLNRRENGALVLVRLDRCLADGDWLRFFPRVQVSHIMVSSSDHMGLMTHLDPHMNPPIGTRRKRRFRFEHIWVRERGCEEAIREAWNVPISGTPMFVVVQKIKQCHVNLLLWSQNLLRVTPRLIESKKARLVQLENCPNDEYDGPAINALRCEVNILVENEEIFWHQRSRVAWLKEGDRNNKYFHACASQRKKMNTIVGLLDNHRV